MSDVRQGLVARLSRLPGVMTGESMFGHGLAYWVNGTEIAHFEGDGIVEVRLTKAVIRGRRGELKVDPRVELRRSGADWIIVRFREPSDVDFVVDLVRRA